MTSTKTPEQRQAAAAKQANREREAAEAMRDYVAEKARIDANMARLRELRLKKEAAEAAAPAKPVASKIAAKSAAAKPAVTKPAAAKPAAPKASAKKSAASKPPKRRAASAKR